MNNNEGASKRTLRWDEYYNLAKAYYEHHGNLEVKSSFMTENGYDYSPSGYQLGAWIRMQRQSRNGVKSTNISNEKIDLLNAIGMRWENLNPMDKWMRKFELAKKYYEHHGELEVPKMFATKNGYDYDAEGERLDTWISFQKRAYKEGTLTEEQKELLDSIGMRWENIDSMIQWQKQYEKAKAFYEEMGHLNVYSYASEEKDAKYMPLAQWLNQQKKIYRGEINGQELNPAQIKLLEDIGINWGEKKYRWITLYRLALIYNFNYGNLDVPIDFKTKNGIDYDEGGFALGEWLIDQQKAYEEGKLSEEKAKDLMDIGAIKFNSNSILEDSMTHGK